MSGRRHQDRVEPFKPSLTAEERVLVKLREDLYEGSWDEMLADLQARRDGKPYVFKFASRVAEDINRISRLRRTEVENGVNLADYV